MKKNQEENKKQFTQDITTQSLCSTHRDCCLLKGCKATYFHLSGEAWELGYCGCSGIIV